MILGDVVVAEFSGRRLSKREASNESTTRQKSSAARAYSSISAPNIPGRPGCWMNAVGIVRLVGNFGGYFFGRFFAAAGFFFVVAFGRNDDTYVKLMSK